MSLFLLDGRNVVPCPDPEIGETWMDGADRVLFETTSFVPGRCWRLTTYFVGLALDEGV